MNDEIKKNDTDFKKKEEKIEESEKDPNNKEKTKEKFIFNCTKCGNCCEQRGPIPITFWDLQMWAKNNVVNNFLTYLKIYKHSKGYYDLILAPLNYKEEDISGLNSDKNENKEKKEESEKNIDELRCPMFDIKKRECLAYEYRPLSCRTYPLEFDGQKYQIVDLECPGIGNGSNTKEERIQIRDQSKKMNSELINMRISIPVLFPVIQKDLMMALIKQQQESMKNMNEEDLKKLNEIMKKEQTQTKK
ncbi:MAG: YkgJ family cysteine cluster protein [Promethearchaeota archaeon]